MFGISFGHAREKIVAVADVGSGSAGVAILAIRPGLPASVIVAERTLLPLEERTRDATVAGVGEQLTKAAENVAKAYRAHIEKGRGAVSGLSVILRPPWSRSKTAHATAAYKKETFITDGMIKELAKKALADEKDLDRENFLEASVMRVELNGYPSGEPVGKRAEEISVFALLSDSPSGIRTEVQTSLQKVFPHLSPIFRSSTWALITVLRALSRSNGVGTNRREDYLIVDMESEGTTFIVVREGIAMEHSLMKEGSSTILKRVSESGMPEETLSLMRMLSRDQCSSSACEAISNSIARAEPELVRMFGEAMGKCASSRRLPNTFVLMVHPDMAPWLSKFFSRIDFAQFTLTTQPFTVETLGAQVLSQWVQPKNGMVLDSGLALAAGLVNIEVQPA